MTGAGDVLLVAGTRCDDRVIRWAQSRRHTPGAARWTHAALITSADGDLIEAIGRTGVRRGHLSAYARDITRAVPVTATARQRSRAVTWAEGHLGWEYGWLDALSVGCRLLTGHRLPLVDSDALICSELVARALAAGAIAHPPGDPRDVSPADLAAFFHLT